MTSADLLSLRKLGCCYLLCGKCNERCKANKDSEYDRRVILARIYYSFLSAAILCCEASPEAIILRHACVSNLPRDKADIFDGKFPYFGGKIGILRYIFYRYWRIKNDRKKVHITYTSKIATQIFLYSSARRIIYTLSGIIQVVYSLNLIFLLWSRAEKRGKFCLEIEVQDNKGS